MVNRTQAASPTPRNLAGPTATGHEACTRGVAFASYLSDTYWRHSMISAETTALLHAARAGDDRACDALFPHVYTELRRISEQRIRRQGGPLSPVTLHDDLVGDDDVSLDQILAVDEALEQLAARDARLARLVELRFYGGMDVDEAAEVLGTSPRTTARDWARAKAYLRSFLA